MNAVLTSFHSFLGNRSTVTAMDVEEMSVAVAFGAWYGTKNIKKDEKTYENEIADEWE